MNKLFLALWLFNVYLSTCDYVRVCYYTNWAQYRPSPMKFFPEDIDASLCTHIIYAFSRINNEKTILDMYESNDEKMYARVMNLKKVNPKLIILLAVGGWNHESGSTSPFSIMVNNNQNRANFIKSVVKLLRKNNFDGFDLDWEYPAGRGNSPAKDKKMFTLLVKELATAFEKDAAESGKPALVLTAAVAAGYDVVDAGYEAKELAKYLYLLNIMAYDLHGTWDFVTGHHTALNNDGGKSPKRKEYTVTYAVEYWISKGFPPKKITLGLATYGRSFYLKNANNHGLSADIDISKKNNLAPKGKFTEEEGLLAYYEICSMGLTVVHDNKAGAPYGYKNTVWVAYDDANSLTKKATLLIKGKNLAGAMFWALDLDDFNGKQCGQGQYPLLNAVKNALEGKPKTSGKINPEKNPSKKIWHHGQHKMKNFMQ